MLWKNGYLVCILFSATHDAETELPDDEREKDKEKKTPYPKQIFYIISMEACERFSYYGMNGKTSFMVIHNIII